MSKRGRKRRARAPGGLHQVVARNHGKAESGTRTPPRVRAPYPRPA